MPNTFPFKGIDETDSIAYFSSGTFSSQENNHNVKKGLQLGHLNSRVTVLTSLFLSPAATVCISLFEMKQFQLCQLVLVINVLHK